MISENDDEVTYPVEDVEMKTKDEDEMQPYQCPHCSKVYVREVTYKRHIAKCNAAHNEEEDMFLNWDDLNEDDYDCDDLFGPVEVRENGINNARTRVVVTQDNCIDHAVEDGEETMAQKFLRHLLRDIRKSTRRSRCDF